MSDSTPRSIPPPPSASTTKDEVAGAFSTDSPGAAASARSAVPPPPHAATAPQSHHWATQLLMLLAIAIAIALFWWGGAVFHLPAHYGYGSSLLLQPTSAAIARGLALAMIGFVVSAAIGHVVGGRHWVYAGPFAACVGLMALSARGGPARFVYFHAASIGMGKRVFLLMLIEAALLMGVSGLIWYATARRALRVTYPDDPRRGLTSTGYQAIGLQIALMALLVLAMNAVDLKKQVACSTFAAGFIATGVAEYCYTRERLAPWWFAGPAAVALLAYLGNLLLIPAAALETGHFTGLLAPLACAVPLDYAGAGMAGAILGYWIAAEHRETSLQIASPAAGIAGGAAR